VWRGVEFWPFPLTCFVAFKTLSHYRTTVRVCDLKFPQGRAYLLLDQYAGPESIPYKLIGALVVKPANQNTFVVKLKCKRTLILSVGRHVLLYDTLMMQ